MADLGHILQASERGAQILLERLPLSAEVKAGVESEAAWALSLTAGDDYELCFTLAPSRQQEISKISERLGLSITQIGRIESTPGLRCLQADGHLWKPVSPGYEHFHHDDED